MNPEPHLFVTGTEPWPQRADTHGDQDDDAGKSFDLIDRDYYLTSEAYGELLAPDPTETTSTTRQAAADTAYAWAPLIDAAIGCRGGDLEPYVRPVQVLDPEGRIVPRRSTPEPSGEWEVHRAGLGRGPRRTTADARIPDHGHESSAMSVPELPIPDVPLIVEHLLNQARQRAGAGAPTEVIEAILDHVAALRESRD